MIKIYNKKRKKQNKKKEKIFKYKTKKNINY